MIGAENVAGAVDEIEARGRVDGCGHGPRLARRARLDDGGGGGSVGFSPRMVSPNVRRLPDERRRAINVAGDTNGGAAVMNGAVSASDKATARGRSAALDDPAIRALLSPGMATQVEIITGRRRVIDYVFSPIARATSEAGRER